MLIRNGNAIREAPDECAATPGRPKLWQGPGSDSRGHHREGPGSWGPAGARPWSELPRLNSDQK